MGRPAPLAVSQGPGAWGPSTALESWVKGLSGHNCRVAVCTFKQRYARLEGTQSPPEILTPAPPSGTETGRLGAVERVASRVANCPRPCGADGRLDAHRTTLCARGSPCRAGGGLPGRGVLSAAR